MSMLTLRQKVAAEIDRQNREMKELSKAAGLGDTYVRDFLKRGRGKVEYLIRIAEALGHGPEWVTGEVSISKSTPSKIIPASNASAPMPPPSYGPPLEVLGTSRGGEDGKLIFNGQVIETIPRPPILEGVEGAYACMVIGDSMKPRFRQGEKVWVHPYRPPTREDGVVVQLHPENDGEPPEGYIKEFVKRTSLVVVLKQFNPEGEFEIEVPLIKSVHVIVGSLYV